AGLVLAVLLGLVVRLIRGPSRDPAMGEVIGRLNQMSNDQAAREAALSERLQAQERALAKAVEERLSEGSRRMGERLQESSVQTQNAVGDLKVRLAVIDAAQRNLTDLSSQVVGLQDILSNKQARGAFGEIQLNDLVSGCLPPSAYQFQ